MKFFKLTLNFHENFRHKFDTTWSPTTDDDHLVAFQFYNLGWKKPGSFKTSFLAFAVCKDLYITESDVLEKALQALHSIGISEPDDIKIQAASLTELSFGDDAFLLRAQSQKWLTQHGLINLINLSRLGTFCTDSLAYDAFDLTASQNRLSRSPFKKAVLAELQRITALPTLVNNKSNLPLHYRFLSSSESEVLAPVREIATALFHRGIIPSAHITSFNFNQLSSNFFRNDLAHIESAVTRDLALSLSGSTVLITYSDTDSNSGFEPRVWNSFEELLQLITRYSVNINLVLSLPENAPNIYRRVDSVLAQHYLEFDPVDDFAVSGDLTECKTKLFARAKACGLNPDEDLHNMIEGHLKEHSDAPLSTVFDNWSAQQLLNGTFRGYADIVKKPNQAIVANRERGFCDALIELDAMIGLQAAKSTIKTVLTSNITSAAQVKAGINVPRPSFHCAFMGEPGTGKTEVARIYARILSEQGITKKGGLVERSGSEAFSMKDAFDEADGAVLFIDEAYALGKFLRTELLAEMENRRDRTVVIIAGYEAHLKNLIASNPGFSSRFTNLIPFHPYSPEELNQILVFMVTKNGLELEPGFSAHALNFFSRMGRRSDQGNGRFVRNIFEKVLTAQQVRLASTLPGGNDRAALATLTLADLEAAISSFSGTAGFTGNDDAGEVAASSGSSATPNKNSTLAINGREKLDSYIGQETVKQSILEILAFFRLQKIRRDKGLPTESLPMHMAFLGNPGTGKTEFAKCIAQILKEDGILGVGELFSCQKHDLVSKFAGETTALVDNLFQQARGSVIFIDEAYSLANGAQGGPEADAVTALIDNMEKLRDEVVVIFAGYTNELKQLFATNPGFSSRVKYQFEFADYSMNELMEIFELFLSQKNLTAEDEAKAKVQKIIASAASDNTFGNARFVRSLVEKAMVKQAGRIMASENSLDEHALGLLVSADFEYQATQQPRRIGFCA